MTSLDAIVEFSVVHVSVLGAQQTCPVHGVVEELPLVHVAAAVNVLAWKKKSERESDDNISIVWCNGMNAVEEREQKREKGRSKRKIGDA